MSRRKRTVITIAAVLGMYVVSYAVLSLYGGFRLIMFSGAKSAGFGSSEFVWQPRFGECYRWGTGYRLDGLGLFFFPLICLDQQIVHPTRPYITFAGDDLDPADASAHPWPRTDQMHPKARRIISVVDAVRERHQAELDAARERENIAEVSRIMTQMKEEAQKELGDQP